MLVFCSGRFGLLPAAAWQDWLANERLDFFTSLQYLIFLLSCFRAKTPVSNPLNSYLLTALSSPLLSPDRPTLALPKSSESRKSSLPSVRIRNSFNQSGTDPSFRLGPIMPLQTAVNQLCAHRAANFLLEQKATHTCMLDGYTETANKDGTWLREMSSCCCLTTAGKTRQLLLNKIYIPFLPSLYKIMLGMFFPVWKDFT